MKPRHIYFAGLVLLGLPGIESVSLAQTESAADRSQSIYTGTTNGAVDNEPLAPQTNTVVKPVAPPAFTNSAVAVVEPPIPALHVASLTTGDLKEFADQSPQIQALIMHALELTKLNLKYEYGSDDPQKGGMDCSGTVYYLLNHAGLKDVPRDASGMYTWAWKEGEVRSVVSSNPKTFELDRLKPGDLLFWIGTYDVQRDPPISHVMIYLGTNRANGHRVMVGASEGRTYEGKPRYGVSVFDFTLPRASSIRENDSRFIGYGPVPGL